MVNTSVISFSSSYSFWCCFLDGKLRDWSLDWDEEEISWYCCWLEMVDDDIWGDDRGEMVDGDNVKWGEMLSWTNYQTQENDQISFSLSLSLFLTISLSYIRSHII